MPVLVNNNKKAARSRRGRVGMSKRSFGGMWLSVVWSGGCVRVCDVSTIAPDAHACQF